MKFFYTFLFLFATSLSYSQYKTLAINEGWQFRQVKTDEWNTVKIPGSNFTGLMENDLIEDPFYRDNVSKLQWIEQDDWEFKTSFEVEAAWLQKEKLQLVFYGLDTYADIYLNDQKLSSTDNMFRTWEADCKQVLKLGQNELRIYFHSPVKKNLAKAEKLGYELPGGKRVMSRKAQFHFGWDFGPRLTSSGIWRPIELHAWDKVMIKDMHVSYTIKDDIVFGKADFIVDASEKQKVEIELSINKKTYRQKFKLSKGSNNKVHIAFKIDDPKLWWTHNLGEPNTYVVAAELFIKKKSSQKLTERIGFRTIELVTNKDARGEEFYFKLNGKPAFMKGANYIPQDIFQSKVERKHYVRILDQARKANMNMLRVWGGGIYEEDIFYELCDRLGILVWQDFMFACAMYPGDADFLDNVEAEAIDNVRRLRHHPCIALWCGNNENSEGWARWGWKDQFNILQQKKLTSDYKKLFNKRLPKVVRSLSPEINYWESSPKLGRGDPQHQFEGDSHYWGVWHDAEPFEMYEEKVPRFMSEYGFQSFPEMSTIESFTKSEDLDPDSKVMLVHQKHPRGNKLIREYMLRDYKAPKDFESFVYISQLVQAEGIALGIEAHRKAQPYCMGTLYWQFNDCWPVASWSSLDYFGRWKALHYKARAAYQNNSITGKVTDNNLTIFPLLEPLKPLIEPNYEANVMTFDGELVQTLNGLISESSDSYLHKLELKDYQKERLVVHLKLLKGERLVSEKYLYWVKPKDLKLEAPELELTVTSVPRGYDIKIQSDKLAKNVQLSTNLNGYFSDNYFDLMPNAEKVIFFETSDSESEATFDVKSLFDTF